MADSRYRVWSCIVYPESAPKNWEEILDDKHISFAVSPLHEFDVNELDGEVKKAHYHVILAFEGKKTFEQVFELTDQLNAPIPKRVDSIRGAVRYLVHYDNPEKHQYNISDIRCFGGFDLSDYFQASTQQRYQLIKDMCNWCLDTGCIEFSDLTRFAMECHYEDWFPLLCDNSAYVIQCFIKSLRHKAK